jgi:hypothetical protein
MQHMAKWLTDAVAAFRGGTVHEPQTFAVRCACGKTVSGERDDSPQLVGCPGCKSVLFVLPKCVYPIPKKPPAPRVQASAPPPAAEESPRAKASQPRARRPTATSPLKKEAAQPKTVVTAPVPSPFDRAPPRRIVTPIRMVLLGLAVVVVSTTGWMIHLRSLRQAEQTVRDAVRLGEAAIKEEDLGEAMRQYQAAREALATLGRDDPEARTVRQTALELTALGRLATRSLHDIVAEAIEMSAIGDGKAWADLFRSNYRDAWIVLDTRIVRRPGAGEAAGVAIELPIVVKGAPVQVVGNLKAFDRLPHDSQPQRAIFAAQLADCRRDPESENGWKLLLAEESAFLWCFPEHLRLLTGTLDPATEQVLAEQALAAGVRQ